MPNNLDSAIAAIHVCSFHELTAAIEVDGELFHFDFSERFGPMVTTPNGRERKEPGPKHKFWKAIALWVKQGKRVANGRAIWGSPPPVKALHLGGRNYCEDTPANRIAFADWIRGTVELDVND